MIISEYWLRDWVNVDLDAQGIADCLTNAGLEVDEVKQVSAPIDNLVVGQVESVVKHPDADRLNLTKVNVGDEVLDIVCGASNVREGLLVAVAKVGAVLPNGLKIKKAKVRGIESLGMLCSAAELGLEETSSGLLALNDDAQLGQRVDEYLQLDDHLIDIDLTPNRGDCLSVQGVARELRVLANAEYHPLADNDIQASSDEIIKVDVQDSQSCPRYLARVITGIDVKAKTPLWMVEKLRRCGIRAISPIVDISNYVMLELGQPMHAFDAQKLTGEIIVRQSKQGEKITLLDDSQVTLDNATLVIADTQKPIAIAGIMGGVDSAIDDTTTQIVLESAHFTRKAISGRARRYGLHTDSSHRFERGVDPQLPLVAIQRASELVIEICGGVVGSVVDHSNLKILVDKKQVSLRFERLQKLLGLALDRKEIGNILARVVGQVDETDAGWAVTPPSYRFDIERECDLVEEVARVKGYNNIPTAMPRIVPKSKTASEATVNIRQLRQTLVARDYHEAITYSFVDPKMQILFDTAEPIALTNPLAENMSVMRTSLLPGLINALQFNRNRQQERIRLFEIGAVYQRQQSGYHEPQKITAVVSGPIHKPQWGIAEDRDADFYDVKFDVEALLSLTGCKEPFIFKGFDHIALHPGQQAKIEKAGVEFGWIGRLHPSIQKQYGIHSAVYVFELDLANVLQAQLPHFSGISRFPKVKRDLSVVVSDDVLVADLVNCVRSELGKTLNAVIVFDVYRGQAVGNDKKSISFGMTLQDKNKTLTDGNVEKLVQRVLVALENKFAAKLRS